MLNSKITTLILIVVAAWFGLMSFGVWRAENTVDRRTGDLKTKIGRLEAENSRLEMLRNHYNDPAYLEKQARARLNYKAQGETVVVVYQDEEEAKKAALSNRSFWEKIKAFIGGLFD